MLVAGAAAGQTVVFQNDVSPFPSYRGTRDTVLHRDGATDAGPWINRNDQPPYVDGFASLASMLVSWDLRAIPAGTPIARASIVGYVYNFGSEPFEIYECLQPWLDSEATFLEYRSGMAWADAGATESGVDHGALPVGVLAAPAGGTRTVPLNDAGVSLVQRWVDQPATNLGLIVQNYLNTDAIALYDCDDPTAVNRLAFQVVQSDGGVWLFRNGVSPDGGYVGCRETVISSDFPITLPFDGQGLGVCGPSDGFANALIAFDVSSLPRDAVVRAARLGFTVKHPAGTPVPLYALTQAWDEATALWTSTGFGPWSDGGALGPADRDPTVLGYLPDGGTGYLEIALNDAGVARVQAWVDGTQPNHGFLIQDQAMPKVWTAYDSEFWQPTARPALVLDVVAADGGTVFPDAGPAMDAGAGSDAGAATDAGGARPDGGGGQPPFSVGCACGSGGEALLLALAALLARARR